MRSNKVLILNWSSDALKFSTEQFCRLPEDTTKASSANLQNCLPPVFDTLGGSLWVLTVWMGKKNPSHD